MTPIGEERHTGGEAARSQPVAMTDVELHQINGRWFALLPQELTQTLEQRVSVLGVVASALRHYGDFELEPPTPLGALRFRMEQGGHTQADFAKLIGSRSHAAEILAGKRSLSKAHIRRLVDEWGIPARSLLGPAEPPPQDEPQ